MLNSKEWTVAFIDYAMSFLEADPAPKNARKLERAQALANELLKIDGWVTLRSKMVAVNAEYPNKVLIFVPTRRGRCSGAVR